MEAFAHRSYVLAHAGRGRCDETHRHPRRHLVEPHHAAYRDGDALTSDDGH
jgi:hypothetical protein